MYRIVRAGSVAAVVLTAAACATTTFQSTWKAPEVEPPEPQGREGGGAGHQHGQRLPPPRRGRARPADHRPGRGGGRGLHPGLRRRDPGRREVPGPDGEGRCRGRRLHAGREQRAADHLDPEHLLGRPPHSAFWGRPGWGRPGYWGWGWSSSFASVPMIQTDTVVSLETLIFDLGRDKLVWVATSRTTNPSNVPSFIREVSGRGGARAPKAGTDPVGRPLGSAARRDPAEG